MQAALHLREQSPHELHFVVSITGLNIEKREMNPSTVPTGQMVLQYVRPFLHAKMASATSVTTAMIITGRLFIHTSTE